MTNKQIFFSNHRTGILLFLIVLVVYGISFWQRQADYSFWLENRQEYVVEDVTAMSTVDAYYWLKMARELDKGTLGKRQADPTKGYPDLVPLAIKDTPSLLAELISLSKNLTGGDYYRAGLMLVPFLAGLFIFPLFFYFNRLGFGASAVLGGLVGSFSHAYYNRTMMGAVDTDLLNTFFPLAAACFILPMTGERTWRANICLAIGAGVTMYLFTRWYQMPAFILVYLFLLAVHLLIGRVHWKQIAPVLLVFLLASGPDYVEQIIGSLRTFLGAYISPPPTGQIVWPDILTTVAEAQKHSIAVQLRMLHGFLPVVFAGFTGLIYLYIVRFKQMIPITPLIILGAWSLVGPTRFAMYLAPFIGIGAGVLIELLTKFAGKKMLTDHRLRKSPVALAPSSVVPLASVSLMLILFFSTSAYTGFPNQTAPAIKASTTRALLEIKGIVPKHSAIFTPFWEYGYPLMEIGDFATYHDGSLHGGMRTTLASKAMMSTRQEEMVSMLAYLEEHGFNHLSSQIRKDNVSAAGMMDLVFGYTGDFRGEDVYVLYLEDTLWKLASMSHFGTWDFDRKKSDPTDYVEMLCFSLAKNIMTCSDGKIDLNRGYMNDYSIDIPLRAALFINDGYVVDQKDYEHDEGYYLQVLMKEGKIIQILVADERLFWTNFNQQYLLGNYDRRYFEEVYNDFPVARLLKVKRADSGRTH